MQPQETLQITKIFIDEIKLSTVFNFQLSTFNFRILILIERQQSPTLSQSFQNGTRMATSPESHVDIRTVGMQCEAIQSLIQHHWDMVLTAHS